MLVPGHRGPTARVPADVAEETKNTTKFRHAFFIKFALLNFARFSPQRWEHRPAFSPQRHVSLIRSGVQLGRPHVGAIVAEV